MAMAEFSQGTAFIPLDCRIDLDATFACGQAFRWRPDGPDAWVGVAGRHRARIAAVDGGITVTPCDEAFYEGFWRHYLDLDGDYAAWEQELACDDVLAPMAACCGGLRLLNQPIWECLISFLLSSNNNVKRISGIVERLCTAYGEDMGGYFAFPTADALCAAGEAGVAGVAACGAGYRAAYVVRTAQAVAGGFDLGSLPLMGYEAAKNELMQLHGVGEKVADCVLLFSCGYREAFPVDVWVQRAMGIHFSDAGTTAKAIRSFAHGRFGKLAGLAQQIMFHFERTRKNPPGPSGTSALSN